MIFGFSIELYVQRIVVLLSKKSYFGKKMGQIKDLSTWHKRFPATIQELSE